MSGLTMPTHVEYHYHYHGPYNNYGQNATGEGTINNINTPPSQSTVTPPQGSDQPETTIRCPPEVLPEDQPTTIHAARRVQSEVKSSPEITPPAQKAQSEDQPTEPKKSPETNHPPAPSQAYNSIANTTNVDRTTPRNIVVFGQAASGKSSIINLLAGSSVANGSGGPPGSTPSNQHSHRGDNYTFWDTPGLDEAKNGTVSLGGDVHNLLNLVKDHGVNLLIYCIRGNLSDIIRVNYDFFWEIICVKEVPIVLVVSGLEGRDEWWQENIKAIMKMKMVFSGHCIMSWNGRRGEESVEKLWKLVREQSTPEPWHMTSGRSVKAQQIIVAYAKHFKARTMRKLLRDLEHSLSDKNYPLRK